jgi:hypothetical protein
MSKMDAMRAMREAKYAQQQATPGKRAAKPQPLAKVAPDPAPSAAAESTESTDALCGHRNMGGRTCTREQGHTAKSHRYS